MKPAILCVPALLAVALAGCTPTPAPLTPVVTGADCIVGDWTADLDDLAQQMAAFYVEHGYDAGLTGSVTGTEHGTFNADGTAAAQDEATFVFTGTRDGRPVTLTSVKSGGFTSNWTLAGDIFNFHDFDGPNYAITTTVEFDGITTTLPTEETAEFTDDMLITTNCSGDVMTMKPDISPFTTTWNRD